MEIDLALLADAATLDAAGKLNMLGIFDRIQTHSFPARHDRIAMVLRFQGALAEAGLHQLQIRLLGPDQKEMLSISGELTFAPGPAEVGGTIRVPHLINLNGIVFEGPGRYMFDVALDGEHARSIPLVVAGPRPGGGSVASRHQA